MKKGNWKFYSINGNCIPCTGPYCELVGDFIIDDNCLKLKYAGDHSADVKI